ncbi:hypothetical protein A0H81_05950 [Grifola frondosa]|uniref:DUF300-domain-containing protein n=1 Tax=Grifola frondosa TaxID=5627 RepID=A0A1C7MBH4_GRIFR|nr:hypothetical protein A0H81_05950 [Grifola frondosa]
MADIENGKCHAQRAPLNSPPLIQHGTLVIQAHHVCVGCFSMRVGWIVSGCFTIVAMVASFWLINKHLQWYTNKYHQRCTSHKNIPTYRPYDLIRRHRAHLVYGAYLRGHQPSLIFVLVLTAFFYLLLLYISPDPEEQKEIFRKAGLSREHDLEARKRGEEVKKWMFPLSFVQWKPQDGLYFLQLMKWGVLQYCVVRPTTTLAAVILDYVGLYCNDSWSLGWGHIYITIVVSISVSVAMYCLIQLYIPVSTNLKPHKPLLKLFAVKAVVFLTFWQATFLSMLTVFGVVKDTKYMTADNINVGISAILETFEMMLFALLHIRAFTYKPYCTPPGRTPRWKSLMHAMNFKETLRELWTGTMYMIRKYRGQETDAQARREAVLESVFGRSRIAIYRQAKAGDTNLGEKNAEGVTVEVEKMVHVGAERQWLGIGDDYGYGLGYHTRRLRERSDGLEEQIEKELTKRGYGKNARDRTSGLAYDRVDTSEPFPPEVHGHKRRSWWQNMYSRISQSGPDLDVDQEVHRMSRASRRRSVSRRRFGDIDPRSKPSMYDVREHDYEDPPPPSAIRTYRESQRRKAGIEERPLLSKPKAPLISATFNPDAMLDFVPRPVPYRPVSPAHTSSPHDLLLPSMNLHISPPFPAPLTDSDHPDSFLGRAFANAEGPSSSSERLTTEPSSQSHYTQVRLASQPAVVPRILAGAKAPVIVHYTEALSSPPHLDNTRAGAV